MQINRFAVLDGVSVWLESSVPFVLFFEAHKPPSYFDVAPKLFEANPPPGSYDAKGRSGAADAPGAG